MMLCGTFERKSLKTVRFLCRTDTTLGHEKENLVQFVANEFSGTVPQLKHGMDRPTGGQCSGQRDLLVR
jgi:hypothetical protein